MKSAVSNPLPPRRPLVLLIDDDIEHTDRLADYLLDFGFDSRVVHDAAAVQAVLAQHAVDLVVMDVVLSACNGLTLLQDIRRAGRMPVVILSRRSEPADRIVGLELGADDYVSKPCEPRELLARLRAILRRLPELATQSAPAASTVAVGRWQLRRDERRLVSADDERVALSASEYRLLSAFLAAPGAVLSREHLMTHARGRELHSLDRGIDLLVSRLRRKLGDDTARAPLIRTVRGRGYIFEPPQRAGEPRPGFGTPRFFGMQPAPAFGAVYA